MTFLRYALPLFAAVAAVNAECSASPTLTISSAGDAAGLANCGTFSGSIAIATDLADTITLAGVRKIDGNLVAPKGSKISGLAADSLEEITGEFKLDEVQILGSLSFPQLVKVKTITWNALPALNQLSFGATVREAQRIDIQNTGLQTLDGISLEVVDDFILANNNFLSKLNLDLGNITTSFVLESNGNNLEVTLDQLTWAFNMTFNGVKSIEIPLLASLNGSLSVLNSTMETFAGPNITTVGKSLTFSGNSNLNNISLPLLTTVNGGYTISKNDKLDEINGFPKLKTVAGALDFYGSFKGVDLPALGDVRGAFNLQSTEAIDSTCSHFDSMHGRSKAIKGKYTCAGKVSTPGGADSDPKTGKKNAAGTIQVSSPLFIGLSGLAVVFFSL